MVAGSARCEEDGRAAQLRELPVVGHRAGPDRRAPQSDVGRRAGAGGAQVQTGGDGGRGSGRAGARCSEDGAGAEEGARGERQPGNRRPGREAWLCDIPRATGQSAARIVARLLNMDAGNDGDLPSELVLVAGGHILMLVAAWSGTAAPEATYPSEADGARDQPGAA